MWTLASRFGSFGASKRLVLFGNPNPNPFEWQRHLCCRHDALWPLMHVRTCVCVRVSEVLFVCFFPLVVSILGYYSCYLPTISADTAATHIRVCNAACVVLSFLFRFDFSCIVFLNFSSDSLYVFLHAGFVLALFA